MRINKNRRLGGTPHPARRRMTPRPTSGRRRDSILPHRRHRLPLEGEAAAGAAEREGWKERRDNQE